MEEDFIIDTGDVVKRRPPAARPPVAWSKKNDKIENRVIKQIRSQRKEQNKNSAEKQKDKSSFWQKMKNVFSSGPKIHTNAPLPELATRKAWDASLDSVLYCGGLYDKRNPNRNINGKNGKTEKTKEQQTSTFYKKYNKFASKKVVSNLDFPTQKEETENKDSDDTENNIGNVDSDDNDDDEDEDESDKIIELDRTESPDEVMMISRVYVPNLPEGDRFRKPKPYSKKHVNSLEGFPKRDKPWISEGHVQHNFWGVNDFTFNIASVETE